MLGTPYDTECLRMADMCLLKPVFVLYRSLSAAIADSIIWLAHTQTHTHTHAYTYLWYYTFLGASGTISGSTSSSSAAQWTVGRGGNLAVCSAPADDWLFCSSPPRRVCASYTIDVATVRFTSGDYIRFHKKRIQSLSISPSFFFGTAIEFIQVIISLCICVGTSL